MKTLLKGVDKDRDILIIRTIQNVFLDIFGEKTLKKVRQILKDNYSLDWMEIPEKSEVFAAALNEIFGKGAVIIEDLIIENLYNSLGKGLPAKKNYTFSDYISLIENDRQIVCFQNP
ncbi:MAG: hypothetical protein QXZ70_05705 [Candidatus Bathyarchaeia archaeon]